MDLMRRIPLGLHASLLAAVGALAGCCYPCTDGQCPHCGRRPPWSLASPPGATAGMWQDRQVAKAEQDQFVVYQLDWVSQSPQLKPDAARRLQTLARRSAEGGCPLVVEPSGDDALDRERQAAMVRVLAESGIQGAEQRVIVRTPRALGLRGEEAEQARHAAAVGSASSASDPAGPASSAPRVLF